MTEDDRDSPEIRTLGSTAAGAPRLRSSSASVADDLLAAATATARRGSVSSDSDGSADDVALRLNTITTSPRPASFVMVRSPLTAPSIARDATAPPGRTATRY